MTSGGPSPESRGATKTSSLSTRPAARKCAGERRTSLEQQRLDAVVGEAGELGLERAGEKLEVGSVWQRPAPERQPARLPRRADVAGGEERLVGPDGSHPDGNRIGGGPELMDEPAGSPHRTPIARRARSSARRGVTAAL